jgi:hypothetical protein
MTQHRPARTYHDDSTWPHLEIGPRDDRGYVEQLIKAIFQAGLSWPTIESHWPAFSGVFYDFDPVQVAAMTEQDINRALQNTRIIRNQALGLSRPVRSAARPSTPPIPLPAAVTAPNPERPRTQSVAAFAESPRAYPPFGIASSYLLSDMGRVPIGTFCGVVVIQWHRQVQRGAAVSSPGHRSSLPG